MKTTQSNSEMMKVLVVASHEYEANCPDMFLMDAEGNYYGVSNNSYATWRNFPKSIDYWRNTEGSDAGRFFYTDEVELPREIVEKFDAITKRDNEMSDNAPVFNEKYPVLADYKTRKAYKQAVDAYIARHDEWAKSANIKGYCIEKSKIWNERIKMFCSFSEKVYEAIKDNNPIKYL